MKRGKSFIRLFYRFIDRIHLVEHAEMRRGQIMIITEFDRELYFT